MSRPRKAPAAPPTELENELSFLAREGYVVSGPAGTAELTPDGRDWMLWAVWQSLGRPGMPEPSSSTEATS